MSGQLDKEEAYRLVEDTLENLGQDPNFSDEQFDYIFENFDKDGSGTIDREEMVCFIMQLMQE